MIILLEGVDGTGKTTLARELAARLDVPYWNRPHNPLYGMSTESSQLLHESEMDLITTLKSDVVVDRFVPSEYAYNKGFGREFNEERAIELTRDCLAEMLVVWLYWPGDATHQDIEDRTDDEVDPFRILEVQRRYKELWNRTSEPRVMLNCMRPIGLQIESVMNEVVRRRPSRDELYMRMAFEAARRSTCLSRRTGAVLVSAHGHVIATGMNGAPCGIMHQKQCARLQKSVASGSGLDECNDVHAEENVFVQAALNGSSPDGGVLYTVNSPCHRCARMAINAKVKEIVYHKLYGDTRAIELFKEAGITMRECK